MATAGTELKGVQKKKKKKEVNAGGYTRDSFHSPNTPHLATILSILLKLGSVRRRHSIVGLLLQHAVLVVVDFAQFPLHPPREVLCIRQLFVLRRSVRFRRRFSCCCCGECCCCCCVVATLFVLLRRLLVHFGPFAGGGGRREQCLHVLVHRRTFSLHRLCRVHDCEEVGKAVSLVLLLRGVVVAAAERSRVGRGQGRDAVVVSPRAFIRARVVADLCCFGRMGQERSGSRRAARASPSLFAECRTSFAQSALTRAPPRSPATHVPSSHSLTLSASEWRLNPAKAMHLLVPSGLERTFKSVRAPAALDGDGQRSR